MDNLIDEFFAKLNEPIDDTYINMNGKRRRKIESVANAQRNAQNLLKSLLNAKINEEGKSALGWRLQTHADELNTLIVAMLYQASQAEHVEMRSREIAEIITGGSLSMQDLMMLGEQDDYEQDWETTQ